MTFKGIYESPEVIPAPCGLFSVSTPEIHTDAEDAWVRRFDYMYDSYATVRLLTTNDDVVTGGEMSNAAGKEIYSGYYPFFIESEIAQSLTNVLAVDQFARALKQLEAVTQKAVEYELWSGVASLGASNANFFLTKGSASTVVTGTSKTASDSLFHLEQALAGDPLGSTGVIHMTRDVASHLGSKLIYLPENGSRKESIVTRLGTKVVVGSGYTGSGPIGATGAAASATNKWMFASNLPYVHLGKSFIVNDTLSQGVLDTKNDILIKALRPAAVYFDPSTLYATQVTLPA